MEKLLNKKFFSYSIWFMVLALTFSCADPKKFDPLKKYIPPVQPKVVYPRVEICTKDPDKESDELVVTFALDITGSNSDAVMGSGKGTDPNRINRYQNLLEWIDKRLASGIDLSHEKYALIEFTTGGNGTIINGGQSSDPEKPFMPLEPFRQLVQAQMNGGSRDEGGTPYKSTIKAMRDLLEQEIKLRLKNYNEELKTNPQAKLITLQALDIMLSDGQPCTSEDGGWFTDQSKGCGQFKQISVTDILDKVKELVDDFPNDPVYGKFVKQVTLNTGFYERVGGDNPEAKDLLSQMALKGKGVFFDFSNGGKIDYDQVVRVETRNIKVEVSDWEIKNLNAQWNEDYEKLLLDSDADGVADVDEFPKECVNKYSCNNSGVRDGVYYQLYGKSCQTKFQNNKEICQEESKGCLKNADGKYLDQDGDRLIECEEAKLLSNDQKFDSNNDRIVDDTAFYRRYFLTDSEENIGNPATQDYDDDGLTDYEEITKTFTPRKINNKDLPGVKPVKRIRVETKFDPVKNQKCDYYRIEDMPTLTRNHDDLIQVTIIDQQNYGSGTKSLRIAVIPMKNGQVDIRRTDFKSYIVK